MIPEVPRGVPADRAKIPEADREFHVLHNAGAGALDLNHARVGLSKALNRAARWAPKIANPVDVNGKGIVYRFDIRDYWGYTLIDTSDPGARSLSVPGHAVELTV
jgi:hypothetical protein